MWERKGWYLELNCDSCSKSRRILTRRTGEDIIKEMQDRGWRALGAKCFCSDCVTEVKG